MTNAQRAGPRPSNHSENRTKNFFAARISPAGALRVCRAKGAARELRSRGSTDKQGEAGAAGWTRSRRVRTAVRADGANGEESGVRREARCKTVDASRIDL